jgi:hypothetical protein
MIWPIIALEMLGVEGWQVNEAELGSPQHDGAETSHHQPRSQIDSRG